MLTLTELKEQRPDTDVRYHGDDTNLRKQQHHGKYILIVILLTIPKKLILHKHLPILLNRIINRIE